MTTLLFHNFPSNVIALVSDRTVDFTLGVPPLAWTEAQRQYLSAHLPREILPIISMRQVHGDQIIEADTDILDKHGLIEADGIVTDRKNFPIAVRTADCLPIFIFDPQKKCIGLVHAGWKGSQQQIAAKAIKKMQDNWSCLPENLLITLGPGIRQCCYQTGDEFQEFFPREVVVKENAFYLDLFQVNKNQLLHGGVRAENILENFSCTCCDPRFFSYRREGLKSGRHISVMMLKGF